MLFHKYIKSAYHCYTGARIHRGETTARGPVRWVFQAMSRDGDWTACRRQHHLFLHVWLHNASLWRSDCANFRTIRPRQVAVWSWSYCELWWINYLFVQPFATWYKKHGLSDSASEDCISVNWFHMNELHTPVRCVCRMFLAWSANIYFQNVHENIQVT